MNSLDSSLITEQSKSDLKTTEVVESDLKTTEVVKSDVKTTEVIESDVKTTEVVESELKTTEMVGELSENEKKILETKIGVEIIDSEQLLTKSQKLKIKQWIKEHKSDDYILKNIHYEQSNGKKYNEMLTEEIQRDDTIIKKIKFQYNTNKIRKELKERIKNKAMLRTHTEGVWKMYYQIINHPTISSLPHDTVKKAIPNPDEVKKQKDTYRMINGVNPNPMIKNYINECLKEC